LLALGAGLVVRVQRERRTTALADAGSSAARTSAAGGLIYVLVPGIENRTQDPVLDATLEVVLATALSDSSALDPYAGPELRTLVTELGAAAGGTDESIGRALAARCGCRVVNVGGAISLRGRRYVLSLTATDSVTGGQVFARTTDEVDGSELVAVVGRLAWEIRRALGESPPHDPALLEQTSMSRSLEADHEYALGMAGLRGLRLSDPIVHFERAVAVDPDFTLAHTGLCLSEWNENRWVEADRQCVMAMQGAARLGRRQRLRLEADYYATLGDYDRSITAYRDILRLWPGDTSANVNLTETYKLKRDLPAMLEQARVAARGHPSMFIARANLANAYLLTGDFVGAERETQSVFRELAGESSELYIVLALAQVAFGRTADAAASYQKMDALYPWLERECLSDLAIYEGRLDDAQQLLEHGIASDVEGKRVDAAGVKWAMLAELYLRRGDRGGAVRAATHVQSNDAPEARYAAAAVRIAAGQKGSTLVQELQLLEYSGVDRRMLAKLLEGWLQLARGQSRDAAAAFRGSLEICESWLGHFALGRAQLEGGQFDEATKEFETCITRRGEATEVFVNNEASLRYLGTAYYYLGRARDGAGRPDAAEAYRDFLALEPNAQHDPLADDARKRASSGDMK